MTKAEYNGLVEAAEEVKRKFAKDFAEWCDAEGYWQPSISGEWHNALDHKIPDDKIFTTDDLLKMFEEETK